MKLGGSGSRAVVNGVVVDTESFKAKYIINAAGDLLLYCNCAKKASICH